MQFLLHWRRLPRKQVRLTRLMSNDDNLNIHVQCNTSNIAIQIFEYKKLTFKLTITTEFVPELFVFKYLCYEISANGKFFTQGRLFTFQYSQPLPCSQVHDIKVLLLLVLTKFILTLTH